jgi:secondary thiamine-phosphate synthase enzyme
MKMFQKAISVQTHEPNEFINITSEIQKVVNESKIKNGMVFANSLHDTASIIIQEDDSTIYEDMFNMFGRILPLKVKYSHDYEGNVNAIAHQKCSLLGTSVNLPLENGKIVLGTWQQIIFIEFLEPRQRKVVVTIIGE